MRSDQSTMVDVLSDTVSGDRSPVLREQKQINIFGGFIRSFENKFHKLSPDKKSASFAQSPLGASVASSSTTVTDPRGSNTVSNLTSVGPEKNNETIQGSTSDCFRSALQIPGSKPPIFVYPHSSEKIDTASKKRFPEVVNLFRRNIYEQPELTESLQHIDYALKLCGTCSQDSHPSILVFCRQSDFKELRRLFKKPELRRHYCLRQPTWIHPWSEPQSSAGRPLFNLYFWRHSRPRSLYWGELSVQIHQRRSVTSQQLQKQEALSGFTMLGSVIQLPGREDRLSTLGCSIKIESDFYAITSMHAFRTLELSETTQKRTPSGYKLISNFNTGVTVDDTIDFSICDDNTMSESDVESDDLTMGDGYYIDDIEYESLSDDEEEHLDANVHKSLVLDSLYTYHTVGSDQTSGSKEMAALFPTPQELEDSQELDLDWAIIKLSDPRDWHPNAFFPSGVASDPVFLSDVAETRPTQETPVFIVTARETPQRGFLQPGVSLLGGISGTTPSALWTLLLCGESRLERGDSGSVVVDATSNAIYGHVVGANPMGEVYISPYAAMIQQIERRFPGTEVTLPKPVVTLKRLRDFYSESDQGNHNLELLYHFTAALGTAGTVTQVEQKSLHSSRNDNLLASVDEAPKLSQRFEELAAGSCMTDNEHLSRLGQAREQTLETHLSSSTSTKSTPDKDSQLLRDFQDYVNFRLVNGVNGEDETAPYVPPPALKRYWSKSRVEAILDCQNPSFTQSLDVVINNCLQILSVVVYIGYPQAVFWFCSDPQGFNDLDFPFNEESLPHSCTWTSEFLSHQWKFFPVVYTEDSVFKRVFPSKTIFPITYEDPLPGEGDKRGITSFWKVRVHPECISSVLEDQPVVFKVYEGHGAEDLYTAEANVYLKLHYKKNEYITKQFASFSFQGRQKYIIVLEYAAGGSLLDFLRSIPPPVTPGNFNMLWDRLLKLLDALVELHDLFIPEGSSRQFPVGGHQHIQPSNILVFPQRNQDSRFDVTFKLADFKLTELGRSLRSGGLMLRLLQKSIYNSPESYANSFVRRQVVKDAPLTADIWSLGTVFSDVLVWSIAGKNGLDIYRFNRKQEILDQTRMSSQLAEESFHNGIERLAAVQEFHNRVLEQKADSDHLSPYMSDFILTFMVTNHRERLSAIQIKRHADRIIRDIQNNLPFSPLPNNINLPSSTLVQAYPVRERLSLAPPDYHLTNSARSPSPIISPAEQGLRTATTPSFLSTEQGSQELVSDVFAMRQSSVDNEQQPKRMVTVDRVYAMLGGKDRINPLMKPGARTWMFSEIMNLPGMQDARSKIAEVKGRDQIMVIDNFSSMEEHKGKVMKTARVISYVSKVADEDGMELYTASETTKKLQVCKTSKQVEKTINKMKTVTGTCNMRKCLDDILNRVLVGNKVKPTSIYIYTDGVWEPGADKVEFAIMRAVDFLIKNGQPSSTLMFQFIQFGHDMEGTARLRYLDDWCTLKYRNGEYGIVDTKHCDDHVLDIVVGSISNYTDGII